MPDQNKSEKATPHKRHEQKKKGNVFQSRDLISGIMILASFTFLRFFGGAYMFGRFQSVINNFINLGSSLYEVDAAIVSMILFELVMNLLFLVLPILSVAMILGVVLSMAQTRIAFTSELLKPKFSRINPIEGIKKMFSLKAFVELIKAMIKLTAVGGVLYYVINSKIWQIPDLLRMDVPIGVLWIADTAYAVALYAGVAMVIIGIFDFIYQWWEHERQLMMSKQEIKDEYKQLEGDPQIKAQRDSIRRQRARERMMSAVKEADVVVRNPEHFAVAIKYDLEKNAAPVVVAKGRDFMAQQIIKEAAKHSVYMVENPPLARALYSSVGIEMEVPQQFWTVMVEIIAHVMAIKGHDLNKLSSDIEKNRQRRLAE